MSARAWAAFAAVSILWGIPYLFIKVAVDDGVSPAFLAWVRVVLAAVVLVALAWRLGLLAHSARPLGVAGVFGVVEIAIPFPLIAAGEQHVASSLAAIIIAAAPLVRGAAGTALRRLRAGHGPAAAGLVIGLAGVVALVGIDVAGQSDELLGALAILLAALCYAIGPMVLKHHFSDLDPRASMGAALVDRVDRAHPRRRASAPPPRSRPPRRWSRWSCWALLCTAAAFAVYASLVSEVGAGRALVITYVAPVVAVALGVAVLDESLGAGAIAGLLLILAGSWLATGGRPPPGLRERAGRRGRSGSRTRRSATSPVGSAADGGHPG